MQLTSAAPGRESMSLPYDRAMPYELKALECALAAGLRILSRDWADLDAEARTPLERLTHKVWHLSQPQLLLMHAIWSPLQQGHFLVSIYQVHLQLVASTGRL